jgi:pimeloyl-ACP methyl ester carboxylesterase
VTSAGWRGDAGWSGSTCGAPETPACPPTLARTAAPAATRTALGAPALVLAGELDGGPLPRVAAAVAKLLPDAELVIQPGAGHYPWLDDPAVFTRSVETFLARPA